MKNIKIVYIATNKYIERFKYFLEELKYFYPNDHKEVILLSNVHVHKYDDYNHNNVSIKFYMIDHYPWPIIALFKMHYIKKFINENDDFIFYFNSNAYPKRYFNDQDLLNDDRLICFRVKKEGYFKTWNDLNPFNHEIKYVQSGLFGGNYNSILEMCNYVTNRVNELLRKNIIDKLHDETALNSYISVLDSSKYVIKDWYDMAILDYERFNSGLGLDNKLHTHHGILDRVEIY